MILGAKSEEPDKGLPLTLFRVLPIEGMKEDHREKGQPEQRHPYSEVSSEADVSSSAPKNQLFATLGDSKLGIAVVPVPT